MNLGLVFLTGLTTGGLSCLAVQGGLLASSIAQQVEQQVHKQAGNTSKAKKQGMARPITLFLGAKLVAYTLLGFFLGWIGSMLQLTPIMQAILQLAVGVFMIGMALRMFNVHPFFRYFIIEPPFFITRYIRRTAKQGTDTVVTPLFLGTLTVLIPCGITQVMMATAVASGNPLEGAAILFAFTLGTSPVFFALAYLATQLGKQWETRFTQVIAVTVLILGLISLNSSFNLLGMPLFAPAGENAHTTANQVSSSVTAKGGLHDNVITINVQDHGYTPAVVKAPAGRPLQLKLVTDNTWGCTRAFVLASLGIQQVLPETGEIVLNLPAQAPGTTLAYSCSMGMYTGVIQF